MAQRAAFAAFAFLMGCAHTPSPCDIPPHPESWPAVSAQMAAVFALEKLEFEVASDPPLALSPHCRPELDAWTCRLDVRALAEYLKAVRLYHCQIDVMRGEEHRCGKGPQSP